MERKLKDILYKVIAGKDINMENLALSIIISTYNRIELLKKNLNKMLRYCQNDIEFIIGDNASQDTTWNELKKIKDPRVRIFRNEINMDAYNFSLLTRYVMGEYFIFLNDRDYIEPRDITKICCLIKKRGTNKEIDFFSFEHTDYKSGKYSGKEMFKVYFASRHPGTKCFRTETYRKNLNYNKLEDAIINQNKDYWINITIKDILRIQKGYVTNQLFVRQPENREKIPRVRKEAYGSVYISLEYRKKEFDQWIKIIKNYKNTQQIRDMLLMKFEDSQKTVMQEYHRCLCVPGFAKRNNCMNLNRRDWIKNGWLLFIFAVRNVEQYGEKRNYAKITVCNYYKMLIYLLKIMYKNKEKLL